MKKTIAMLLTLVMMFGLAACGGGEQPAGDPAPSSGTPAVSGQPAGTDREGMGTILWLSDPTDDPQHKASANYLAALCRALGYEFAEVRGDSYNDPANNLLAVRSGMTEEVVGIIAGLDGGLAAIMEAYPDVWVAGYNTDMRTVYAENGENAACLQNPKFLGTIADGYGDGAALGQLLAQRIVDGGFKKAAIISLPPFAYPGLNEADTAFRAAIEEYNQSASEPIAIVGETTVLMFDTFSDQWFLEEGHDDLDVIINLCGGMFPVYQAVVSAVDNGLCSVDTKLISVGFESDPGIAADMGENGRVSAMLVTCPENAAYPLILIDNAVTGNVAAGTGNVCIDGGMCLLDSAEDMELMMTASMLGTGDVGDAYLTLEEVVALCGRTDPGLTWEELVAVFQSICAEDVK